eukprot:188708-Amphidinium_carterae.2
MAALWSQGMYGAEVNGLSQALVRKLRSAGRAALGKGARKRRSAEIELSLTFLGWAGRQGSSTWGTLASPTFTVGACALKEGGPLSALAEFAQRVSWQPGEAGWHTTRGFVPWCQASATGAQDSQASSCAAC